MKEQNRLKSIPVPHAISRLCATRRGFVVTIVTDGSTLAVLVCLMSNINSFVT